MLGGNYANCHEHIQSSQYTTVEEPISMQCHLSVNHPRTSPATNHTYAKVLMRHEGIATARAGLFVTVLTSLLHVDVIS